jgi:hypothetical protein
MALGIVSGQAEATAAGCGPFEDARRTSYRRISWEDFQGPRPERVSLGQKYPKIVVRIAVSTHIDEWRAEATAGADGNWTARAGGLCIRAYMHKDRSGDIPEYREPEDLVHEQGHFDIAQLAALALRASIEQLEVRADSREHADDMFYAALQRVYRETVAEYKQLDDRYERATSFGNRARAQQRWCAEIAARLEAASAGVQERVIAQAESQSGGELAASSPAD